ncbi:neurogenic differentiation factor 6-like [Cimex lectularius]|uniref:BHLH domain-containing protein n=1 Tax=Cimex lectularius TaxID=79782 RepID=A0A8I6R6Q4_CIMLE|nr:neurogenic differentiation factor 6-like [Cimex lectularius]
MEDVVLLDSNNNSHPEKIYSLRPRSTVRKTEDEEEEILWKRRPRKRPKTKPVPLSKYRRKTANARERCRMREINEAFDCLRRCVPHGESNEQEKLTKISTLRLAMKYIAALSAALAGPEEACQLPPTPPVSDSPPSPPQEISSITDLQDFDPFSEATIDFDDFFFT